MQHSPCHAMAAGGRFSSSMLSIDGEARFAQILIGIDASILIGGRRPSTASFIKLSQNLLWGFVDRPSLIRCFGGVLPGNREVSSRSFR